MIPCWVEFGGVQDTVGRKGTHRVWWVWYETRLSPLARTGLIYFYLFISPSLTCPLSFIFYPFLLHSLLTSKPWYFKRSSRDALILLTSSRWILILTLAIILTQIVCACVRMCVCRSEVNTGYFFSISLCLTVGSRISHRTNSSFIPLYLLAIKPLESLWSPPPYYRPAPLDPLDSGFSSSII